MKLPKNLNIFYPQLCNSIFNSLLYLLLSSFQIHSSFWSSWLGGRQRWRGCPLCYWLLQGSTGSKCERERTYFNFLGCETCCWFLSSSNWQTQRVLQNIYWKGSIFHAKSRRLPKSKSYCESKFQVKCIDCNCNWNDFIAAVRTMFILKVWN